MGHKPVETTHNINNTFGPELLMNAQCSDGSRSFAKETKALKMRITVVSHQKLTVTHWEQPSKLILTTTGEASEELNVDNSIWSFGIWRKLERWKNSISGFLMSWQQIKKLLFWSVSSLIVCNSEPFLNRIVGCKTSGLYMTTSNAQLSDWTEKKLQITSQNQTCTKRKSHGHYLVVCCQCDPL